MISPATDDDFIRLFAKHRNIELLDTNYISEETFIYLNNTLISFDSAIKSRADKTRPGHKVAIAYSDSLEFNAFATKYLETDVIIINAGIPLKLISLFRCALSHDKTLNWLASTNLTPIILDNEIPLIEQLCKINYDIPLSEPREKVAAWLTQCALLWIFYHEQGHIWNGHLEYVDSQFGIREINEISIARSSGPACLDFRTLEFDADGYATANLFAFVHLNWPSIISEDSITLKEADEILDHLGTAFVLMSFSVYLMLKSWQEILVTGPELEDWTHPPAPQRAYSAILAASAAGSERYEMPLEVITDLVRTGAILAEQACARLTQTTYDTQNFNKMREIAWANICQDRKNWHKLYPQLDTYKRGGNLPPPQQSAFEDS